MCECKCDAKCKTLMNTACSSCLLILASHITHKSCHMQARKSYRILILYVALAKVI